MAGKREPSDADPRDPVGMVALRHQFLEWMRVKNYSPETIATRGFHLDGFIDWAAARGIAQPQEVTKPVIEHYQRYLYHYRKRNGDPLSVQSQGNRLVAVRAWFRWMAKGSHILFNPAAEIDLPKLESRLPKYVLTASEAEQVINRPDVATWAGIRDRAILETFYSCGMRRRELIGLHPYDLDAERGVVVIRKGKGRKDRVIPIGDRALAWIDRYQVEVRPGLLVGEAVEELFLTRLGKPFTPDQMTELVGGYVTAAEIGKQGSCHLFRHSMATLMYEAGADLRSLQEMLGHARLETTQIYTRVSIRKLKEVHTATHPAQGRRSP